MYNTASSVNTNTLENRNKRLLGLFTAKGYNVRLIGGESPMVVLDDKYIISCFVNNFTLHFLKRLGSNKIIKSFDLKKEIFLTKYELDEILNMCELFPAYRIRLNSMDLYLVGYNCLKDNEGVILKKYPVFAKHHPIIYADLSNAEKVDDILSQQGYDVEIEYS
jgi:hypothetical protein